MGAMFGDQAPLQNGFFMQNVGDRRKNAYGVIGLPARDILLNESLRKLTFLTLGGAQLLVI